DRRLYSFGERLLDQVDAASPLDRFQHGKREQHAAPGLPVWQWMFSLPQQERRPRGHLFGVTLAAEPLDTPPAMVVDRELAKVLQLRHHADTGDGADLLRPGAVTLSRVNELSR